MMAAVIAAGAAGHADTSIELSQATFNRCIISDS